MTITLRDVMDAATAHWKARLSGGSVDVGSLPLHVHIVGHDGEPDQVHIVDGVEIVNKMSEHSIVLRVS